MFYVPDKSVLQKALVEVDFYTAHPQVSSVESYSVAVPT
jgi:hypothetical protein